MYMCFPLQNANADKCFNEKLTGRRIWDRGFIPVQLHCTVVQSLGLTFPFCQVRVLNLVIIRLQPL